MKKLVCILCLSTLVGFAQAQTTTTPAKVGKHQKIKMVKELNFSNEQKQEMKAIKQKNKDQEAIIKSNTALSDGDKQQQLKQLKLEKKKSVAKLLTTEQKAKLADLQQKKSSDKPKTEL